MLRQELKAAWPGRIDEFVTNSNCALATNELKRFKLISVQLRDGETWKNRSDAVNKICGQDPYKKVKDLLAEVLKHFDNGEFPQAKIEVDEEAGKLPKNDDLSKQIDIWKLAINLSLIPPSAPAEVAAQQLDAAKPYLPVRLDDDKVAAWRRLVLAYDRVLIFKPSAAGDEISDAIKGMRVVYQASPTPVIP